MTLSPFKVLVPHVRAITQTIPRVRLAHVGLSEALKEGLLIDRRIPGAVLEGVVHKCDFSGIGVADADIGTVVRGNCQSRRSRHDEEKKSLHEMFFVRFHSKVV